MIRSALFFCFLLISGISLAQKEGFEPITSEADFMGLWILVDTNNYIHPLCDNNDPDCQMTPGGDKLIADESAVYFTSYIHPEFGASIELQFTYELSGNKLDCILTQSNALGYLMQNENQPFGLKMYVSKSEELLGIELDDRTFHELRPITEEDLK